MLDTLNFLKRGWHITKKSNLDYPKNSLLMTHMLRFEDFEEKRLIFVKGDIVGYEIFPRLRIKTEIPFLVEEYPRKMQGIDHGSSLPLCELRLWMKALQPNNHNSN